LFHVPAVPVEVVDATGAGDSFCGGALVGFVHTGDPIEAMLSGAVSASFAVETLGLSGLAAATGDEALIRLDALRQRVTRGPI
jgi:sugar/nucleoside kinase (ribokinase family)